MNERSPGLICRDLFLGFQDWCDRGLTFLAASPLGCGLDQDKVGFVVPEKFLVGGYFMAAFEGFLPDAFRDTGSARDQTQRRFPQKTLPQNGGHHRGSRGKGVFDSDWLGKVYFGRLYFSEGKGFT